MRHATDRSRRKNRVNGDARMTAERQPRVSEMQFDL
jgi:hypothetical protein